MDEGREVLVPDVINDNDGLLQVRIRKVLRDLPSLKLPMSLNVVCKTIPESRKLCYFILKSKLATEKYVQCLPDLVQQNL